MIAQPSSASSVSVARTGKVLTDWQVMTAPAACSGGEISDRKRPPSTLQQRVHGQQARPQRLRAVQALTDHGRVVHAHRHPPEAAVEGLRGHPHAAAHRIEGEVLGDRQLGEPRRRQLDAPLDGLVPHADGLEEPRGPPQRRVLAGLDHGDHPDVVERRRAALGVDRWVDDPERRRRRVLRRARRVGEQRVALPQQRADELLELGHGALPEQVGDERVVGVEAARGLQRHERVEGLRAQADPAAARILRGDRAAPRRDGHRPLGRAAPRHLGDLQAVVLAAVEDHPGEVERQRGCPSGSE